MASPTSCNAHIDEHRALGKLCELVPAQGSQQCTPIDVPMFPTYPTSLASPVSPTTPIVAPRCSVEIEKQQLSYDHNGTSTKKSRKVSFFLMPQIHTYDVDDSGSRQRPCSC